MGEIRGIIRSGGAFFKELHAQLFDRMVEMFDKHGTYDHEQIRASLPGDVAVRMGHKPVLEELMASAVAPARAIEHAREVHDKAMLRRLIDTVSDILYDASRTSDHFPELLGRAQQRLDGLAEEAGIPGKRLSD
jgi:replicative DNA helicase